MKKFAAVLCALLWSAQTAADPLALAATMSPRAAQSLMLGVTNTGTRVVAVGERGIVIYSENGGATWTQARTPVSVTLTAVTFPDAKHGYAVGHDGAILASSDGGKQWHKLLDGDEINIMMMEEARRELDSGGPHHDQAQNAYADVQAAAKFGPSRPLLAVWFRNAHKGWVVGAYGQALRTHDGGKHWESIAGRLPNPDGLHLNSITQAADGSLLVAGEGGRVYRSTDDGDNWRVMDTGYSGQLYGVTEPAPGALLAYGFGGHLLRSDDGGAHWRDTPLGSKALVAAATTGDSLLVAARDGSLYRSTDQGHSFTPWAAGGSQEVAGMALQGAAPLLAGMGGVRRGGQ